MDNSYILLLILKKGINVGLFIRWYSKLGAPTYVDYCASLDSLDTDSLCVVPLNDFEFNYLVSYFSLRGVLCR